MSETRSAKQLLLPVFVTVFIDMLGATIVLPVLAPLLLDFTNGVMPIDVSGFIDLQLADLKNNRNII